MINQRLALFKGLCTPCMRRMWLWRASLGTASVPPARCLPTVPWTRTTQASVSRMETAWALACWMSVRVNKVSQAAIVSCESDMFRPGASMRSDWSDHRWTALSAALRTRFRLVTLYLCFYYGDLCGQHWVQDGVVTSLRDLLMKNLTAAVLFNL